MRAEKLLSDPLALPEALSGVVRIPASIAEVEPVRSVTTPVRLEYVDTPGKALSAYLKAMKRKRLVGEVCGVTGQVFVPPRGVSPLTGKATAGTVELADTGYVESFNITRLPIKRRPDLVPPYCTAWVVPDGASVGMLGLVIDIAPEEVRIGLRVRAVWKPDEELTESTANLLGWAPTGEPDVHIDDYELVGRSGPPPRQGTAQHHGSGGPAR